MTCRTRRQKLLGHRGFSVIEVIAALGFLSVSFLGLTSLSLMTIKATSQARSIAAATNLARGKIEELRQLGYAGATSGADSEKLSESGQISVPQSIYTRSWSVTSGPTATTKSVSVTVMWTAAGAKQVTLDTIIGQ